MRKSTDAISVSLLTSLGPHETYLMCYAVLSLHCSGKI